MIDSLGLGVKALSKVDFPRTWAVLETGVADGVAPGFVSGFWVEHDPNVIHVAALGNRRVIPSPLPLFPETVFDLASVTKVLATATLAAVLVDRGWMSWNTSLSALFPNYPFQQIQMRHLLSHTAGFSAWEPIWQRLKSHFVPRPLHLVPLKDRQIFAKMLALSWVPERKPEERSLYSDLSFILLGFALEELTQMDLDQAVETFVWKPMGIRSAYFKKVTESVEQGLNEAVAATENCTWRAGILQGQVHDDNCWAMGGVAGHAGAFGTVRDVLQFSKQWLRGFLSPQVTQEAWTRVLLPVGCERTLGWDSPSGDMPSAGPLFSKASVGHLGFTGTSLWIDPRSRLAVTLLSNRVHPSRENVKIRSFRFQFHKAIRTDLKENMGI